MATLLKIGREMTVNGNANLTVPYVRDAAKSARPDKFSTVKYKYV